MGRPLRMWEPDQVYLVTNRTLEERFWFKPSPETEAIFGFWLARAVDKFEIKLYAALLMSNHPHLIVGAPKGNLSSFMEYLQLNVTKAINRLRGRSGTLWKRRFSAEPILDGEAMLDRMGYVLANPVSAHLVRRADEWGGFSTLSDLGRQTARVFTGLDCTAWRRAGQPKQKARFMLSYPLVLSRLPGFETMRATEYRKRILQALHKYEDAAREVRIRTQKVVMSRRQLESIRPSSRPHRPKRSPRPLCHCSQPRLARAFKAIWDAFRKAYRKAAAAYREGIVTVIFPPGSFPPSRFPHAQNGLAEP